MSVVIGELIVQAQVEPIAAVAPQANGGSGDDSMAAVERTRRRAERALRIACRARSEGYDD